MKRLFIVVVTLCLTLGLNVVSFGQCAMCRATLETNVSNGSETILSSSLNLGIMYLFAAPYVLIAAVGLFWYKTSKRSKNEA